MQNIVEIALQHYIDHLHYLLRTSSGMNRLWYSLELSDAELALKELTDGSHM